MQKKIVVFAAAFLLVLVLTGCSQKKAENSKFDSQTRNQSQVKDGAKDNSVGLSVCSGKSEGDSCEIMMSQKNSDNGSSNTLAGTCKKSPKGDQLSCVPAVVQGGPGRGARPDRSDGERPSMPENNQ